MFALAADAAAMAAKIFNNNVLETFYVFSLLENFLLRHCSEFFNGNFSQAGLFFKNPVTLA